MSSVDVGLKEKQYNRLITVVSIVVPLVVALLFGVNLRKLGFDVEPLTFLPPIYATINGITAVLLVAAYLAIRKGKIKTHKRLMTTAIGCSVLFLILYIAYHMTSDSTRFGGEGIVRYLYYFILITHIVLSIGVIPFVLITYARALLEKFDKHRKIARITFPLWLYVAVTGVVVYLMISPYYAH